MSGLAVSSAPVRRRWSRSRWRAKASCSISTRPRRSPPISTSRRSRPELIFLLDSLQLRKKRNKQRGSPVRSALFGPNPRIKGARDELVGRYSYRREYALRPAAGPDHRRTRYVRRPHRCRRADDPEGLTARSAREESFNLSERLYEPPRAKSKGLRAGGCASP